MLAEWTGLEPATPGVTGRYSNQLNYHSALVKPWTIAQRWVYSHSEATWTALRPALPVSAERFAGATASPARAAT